MKTISIIGSPNVGKSTLFNRFVAGAGKAITSDFAGVTRDHKIADAQFVNLRFKLIDTAGFSLKIGDSKGLQGKIERQAISAITKSNLVLFVVDGTRGITEHDKSISVWLKKKNLPVIVVVNKSDTKKAVNDFYEFHSLGYEDLCSISAEHKLGFDNLYELIEQRIGAPSISSSEDAIPPKDQRLKIAIIGRPNVGKSTLINSFLKEERVITGEEAGITRDSIFIDIKYKKRQLQLIDTAGMRKQGKVTEKIERLAIKKSIEAIRICDIAVLVMDANNPLEKQELKLASLVIQKEIKPLIVAINKTDSLTVGRELLSEVSYVVRKKLSRATKMPIIYISATNAKNINKILDECIVLQELWSTRLPTSQLNKWLERTIEEHQPPLSRMGKRIKIKFINQTASSPPTFQIFSNQAQEISDQYLKYLTGSLQSHFNLDGVPIKICKMKAKNPYT